MTNREHEGSSYFCYLSLHFLTSLKCCTLCPIGIKKPLSLKFCFKPCVPREVKQLRELICENYFLYDINIHQALCRHV